MFGEIVKRLASNADAVARGNGRKHQDRRGWYLALLGLAAASTAYVALSGAEKPSYDASNIPGCVSQSQWTIAGDIPP